MTATYHVESHFCDHGSHKTLEAAVEHAKRVQAEIDAEDNIAGDMAQVRAYYKSGLYRSQQIMWPKQGALVSTRA